MRSVLLTIILRIRGEHTGEGYLLSFEAMEYMILSYYSLN